MQFVEYERMVYLDADMQVYENIDHLFDLDKGKFHAVMDCFCEKTWSHTPQYKIGYCQQSPDRVAAWPEQELDLPPQPPPLYFNAGMFVHEPSLRTARALLDALAATPPTPFAEQDFLNLFFRDAYAPLPPTYNLVLAMLWRHPDRVAPALHEVKVVHYCAAGAKPWRYTGKEPNMEREDVRALVAKWWDIFDDESLDYDKQQGAAPPVEDQARLPLRQAMAQAGPFKHFPAPSAA
jgi:inositol 3-alpha-galactosyltransferase